MQRTKTGKDNCDCRSFNGRTRVFEARYERSTRSPVTTDRIQGVVRVTVTSWDENTASTGSSFLRGHSPDQDYRLRPGTSRLSRSARRERSESVQAKS